MKYDYAIEMLKLGDEGVEIKYSGCEKFGPPISSLSEYSVKVLNDPNKFRAKPAPRKVPLSLSDIRAGMVFRACGGVAFYNYYCAGIRGVQLSREGHVIEYATLAQKWEYSTDGINFHPCEKDEVVE